MELLVLLPLIGWITLWKRILGLSLSSTALHVVSAIILVLFLGGLAGQLPAMRLVLLSAGTAALIYELARHRNQFLASLSSVPMLVFLVLCVIYPLVHGGSEFRYYDEFSHWGINLRDMVALNGFWGADTNSMHPTYPPGITLWQYFFAFSWPPKESAAYFAQFTLLLAPVLVLFQSMSWKHAGWVVGVVVLIFFSLGNYGLGIASLYNDHVVSVFLAGTFLNFMAQPRDSGNSKLLLYLLPLSALALTKNAGLLMALALPFLFFALHLVRNHQRVLKDKLVIAVGLLLLSSWLAGPLLVSATWSANRQALGAVESRVNPVGIFAILSGKAKLEDPQRAELAKDMFRDVFFNLQISKNEVSGEFNEFNYQLMPRYEDRFKLTTFWFLVFFAGWSVLLVWFLLPARLRMEWAIGLSGMLGIALVYIGILYLTYLFYRANLVSYVRYVHTVLLPLLLVAFAPLLPAFTGTSESSTVLRKPVLASRRPVIFAAALIALLVIEQPYYQTLLPNPGENLTRFRAYIKETATTLRHRVGEQRLWLYLPDEDQHNFMSRVMLYELSPTPTTINRDFSFFDTPRQALLSEWARHDFVWVAYQDEKVDGALRNLVGGELGERFYRVVEQDGQLKVVHASLQNSEPGSTE